MLKNNILTSIHPTTKVVGLLEGFVVKIKKLTDNAVLPTYAKPGDAGADIVATSYEYDAGHDLHIYHTGLAFEVPEGYVMLIFPRSSNTKKDCYLPNSVGVLDSGYRGELTFRWKNRDRSMIDKPYDVGDKIGQVIILPYPQIEYVEADVLSETVRGTGGFGSTGK